MTIPFVHFIVRSVALLLSLRVAAVAGLLGLWGLSGTGRANEKALCSGDYADEATVLSPRVRALELDPENRYSYCVRTVATYECLSYASDGSVRRARKTTIAHGTAFAYRRGAGDTLLVTNAHVATWPLVTDEDHTAEDVPAGCKMVSESLKVVDDEDDGYEANDIPLTRVVDAPSLDVTILRAHALLTVMPWRTGHSAALHVGNVVAVHGFPLGAFPATNVGKVVNTHDHDTSKDWDHVDFVTDALLSPGNSGSPVLAVSCKTGQYELVGIYHAGYVKGSALNVVIGIDEVRGLMTTLRKSPRPTESGGDAMGPAERKLLVAEATAHPASTLFSFGNLMAMVRPAPASPSGALLFEVYSHDFPLHQERLLLIEDLPLYAGFGQIGRVYLGNQRGLGEIDVGALDADAQAQLARILSRLRAGALSTVRYRALESHSREGIKAQRAIERARRRAATVELDAAQSLSDLADCLGPKAGEPVLSYAAAVALPQIAQPKHTAVAPR